MPIQYVSRDIEKAVCDWSASLTFNAPLVLAAAGRIVRHVVEVLGPWHYRQVAPARARVNTAAARFRVLGLLEAHSTSLDRARLLHGRHLRVELVDSSTTVVAVLLDRLRHVSWRAHNCAKYPRHARLVASA